MENEAKNLGEESAKESAHLKLSGAELREFQERLKLIVRKTSGKPNLDVTNDVDFRTLMELAKQGKDARREWYRYAATDPKTGKQREYVHIPDQLIDMTENFAKGAAAHEAGHVAISRMGEFIPEEVSRELGFSAVISAIEERPTDQVVRERYAGAGKWVDEVRKTQSAGAPSQLKELRKKGALHYPKFMQFADLCVFGPHYSELPSYDEDVLKVYEETKDFLEQIENTLPEEDAREEVILEKAKDRYKIVYAKVWQKAKALVASDLAKEKLNQMAADAIKKEKDKKGGNDGGDGKDGKKSEAGSKGAGESQSGGVGETKNEEDENDGQPGGQSGGGKSAKENTKEQEGGQGAPLPAPLDKLPKHLQEELKSLLRGSKSKKSGENQEEKKETDAKAGEKTDEKTESDKDDKGGEASGEDEAGNDNDIDGDDKDAGENNAEGIEEDAPANTRLPEMSDELSEALQKIYNGLSEKEKEFLEFAARQALKELEDKIAEEFSGKLEEAPMETHEDRDARTLAEKEAEERKKRRATEKSQAQAELGQIERREAEIRAGKDEYEKTYELVRELDEALYRKLEEVFTPNIKRAMKLRSQGAKINLPAVFRWEADRGAKSTASANRIFETTHLPEKQDYAFTILVDMSSSMYGGWSGDNIMKETFKAVVLLLEVLNRLGVKAQVLGFHDVLKKYKEFSDELNDSMRKKISGMLRDEQGWTNTGQALMGASAEMEKNQCKENFLLVLTDGRPQNQIRSNADMEREAHQAVAHILKQTNQKLVGVGLGQRTEFVRNFFPTSFADINTEELVEVLGGLLEDMILNPEKYAYNPDA